MLIGQKEFDDLMVNIDDKFDDEFLALPKRPINGVLEVFERLDVSGVLFGGSKQPATFPIVVENLSSHVTKWYDDRYGDALKMDMSVGRFPFLLKGVVYACKLPLIYGSVQVVFAKGDFSQSGVLNAFDLVQGLPSYAREKITGSDENKLMYAFQIAIGAINNLNQHKSNPIIESALSDALVSCDQLLPSNPNYALSAWHSLQFAEKVVKYFISKFEEPKRTHEIKKLRDKAKNFGYIDEGHVNWDCLNLKPDIRYEPNSVSIAQALDANLESWKVAFDIMRQIKA